MATHSTILTWKIPWTEEPGELQSMGVSESDATDAYIHTHVCVYLFVSLSSASTSKSIFLLAMTSLKS